MRDKILDLLKKKEGYVSGEEIARHLKISRQALWKHIQDLKDAGYGIEAVPHLGYHLASIPDRLFEIEVSRDLNTNILGRKIFYFDSLSSTMDKAMELGVKGAASGTLVLAESQNQGRGRLGRVWFSPKYKGLYLSLILRPDMLPTQASILTLLSAVSICEAIKTISGINAQIKWPNDILIHNKKLAGILTQVVAETDKINFVIIGIGINVNTDREHLPREATSLKAEAGGSFSRVELTRELLREFERQYLIFKEKGFKRIIEEWKNLSHTLGEEVKIVCQNRKIEGTAVDLDASGALVVRMDNGFTEHITAGDVIMVR